MIGGGDGWLRRMICKAGPTCDKFPRLGVKERGQPNGNGTRWCELSYFLIELRHQVRIIQVRILDQNVDRLAILGDRFLHISLFLIDDSKLFQKRDTSRPRR